MKKSLGLLGCAFFLTCAGAEAAPITYDIDQAFWGQYSATTLYTALEWQAQRQLEVNANPSAYNFLTGSVTLDWDTQTVTDYGLGMDVVINGVETVASFAPADTGSSIIFNQNAGGGGIEPSEYVTLNMATSWGPVYTYGSNTGAQYRARLSLTIVHFLTSDDLALTMLPSQVGEFQRSELCPSYDLCFISGAYDDGGVSNPATRTYGGGVGISEANAVVPLPAGLPLLGGALGLFGMMGWRNRRRARC